VVGPRRRVGQRRRVVAVPQVAAGVPLPVLPEVFFPPGDGELLDEQARVLAVPVQGPVDGAGPQPRLTQPGYSLVLLQRHLQHSCQANGGG
jgi:hypothetical protein